MRVAVLDIDQTHNLRLRTTFKDNEKVELVFCTTVEELLTLLNGSSSEQSKIEKLEKTLVDGGAMLARAIDGIQKALLLVAEKQKALAGSTIATKPKIDEELAALNAKIASAKDIRGKIELAIAARSAELQTLKAASGGAVKKKFDLIFVDRAFLGNIPSDWNLELRAKIDFEENKEVPVIAMGYNEDLGYIKNTLHGGVSNYFVKPVDLLLLHQTLGTGEKVFELQAQAPIRILKNATTYKLSEFELNVETDILFRPGELVEFYVDMFGGEKDKRVLARCISSEQKEGEKYTFLGQFMIVGHTPHTMTEMRKWIRARYVADKSKES